MNTIPRTSELYSAGKKEALKVSEGDSDLNKAAFYKHHSGSTVKDELKGRSRGQRNQVRSYPNKR